MTEKIPKWFRIIIGVGLLVVFVCGLAFYGTSDPPMPLSDTDKAITSTLSVGSLGSLVVMGLALAILLNRNQKKALPIISIILLVSLIIISCIVFLGSAFWQFLAMGLAGHYQPFLATLIAFVAFGIISIFLVIRAFMVK